MKNLPTILAAAALLVVLLLYMCTFQVRATEVAICKTFGNVDPQAEGSIITEPGLYRKWPWPVQSVVKYDQRLRVLTDRTDETRTADSRNIILTTYTVWTIADPYKFHVNYQNEEQGSKSLRTKIRSHKLAVAGKHPFSHFVSTDPNERKLARIEQEMQALVGAEAAEQFGVEIRMFGIKQLALPQEVSKAVFASMKETEETKAKKYQAEGEAEAAEIIAQAAAARQRILAVTRRKVDAIRNDAQAEVSRIWEAFREEPELRIFLDKLEALEVILKKRTTFILDQRWAPIDLFDDERRLAPASLDGAAISATLDAAQKQDESN
ncbi:MAG: hypothetical protein GY778_15290 [bacterium]|nr:hypothetical protein [bacterium]